MNTRVAPDLSVRSGPGPVLGSLCTGYGGLDLGVLAVFGGGRIALCADHDPQVEEVLAARLPDVPNLGDVRLVDWAAVEQVDVLAVGFPCQEISAAGQRRGIEKGTRSGVWIDVVEGIRVLRPQFVVENVAALRWKNGGLHRVLGDLAAAGYDAVWRSVRASDVGAPHRRERVFLLAWPAASNTAGPRRRQPRCRRSRATACPRSPGESPRRRQRDVRSCPASLQAQVDAIVQGGSPSKRTYSARSSHKSWRAYSGAIAGWENVTGRATPHPTVPGRHGGPVLSPAFVEHLMGLPAGWLTDLPLSRVDHLRVLGNGVVPHQAAHAVSMLLSDLCSATHTSPRGRAA